MQKDCWRCIIMNGMKPKFLEGKINSIDYYETPNPYVNAISSDIDLLILSRYAKKAGKRLIDLTVEEIEKIKNNK